LSPLDFRAGSIYQANLRQWQFAEKVLPNSVVNISELLKQTAVQVNTYSKDIFGGLYMKGVQFP